MNNKIKKFSIMLILEKAAKTIVFLLITAIFFYIGNLAGKSFFPGVNPPKVILTIDEVKPGQSLYQILTEDFSSLQALNIGGALSEVYDASRLRTGQKYTIYHSTSGKVLRFVLEASPLVKYVVESTDDGYQASRRVPEHETKITAVKGEIGNSLWQGMADSGLTPAMIMNFSNIFQWQVDFLTEVRRGDRFMIVFERFYRDSEPVQDGPIIAAWYEGRAAGNVQGIRLETDEGVGFYDSSGNSLRKQFLRAPLNYTRISSGFSYARRHPITREVRPHLSIDYAAPTGTPVQAVASGRVVFVGWRGGWGETVRIRHNSVYTTQYAHLSRYGSGIRVGANVSQGQTIGYVGMTGTATGPHLCFRIEQNGTPVNYLRLEFPPADSVSGEYMEEFEKYVNRARKYYSYLESDFFSGEPRAVKEFKSSPEYASLSE